MPRRSGTVPCMHRLTRLSTTQADCINCGAGAQEQCYHKDCGQHPPIKHTPVTASKLWANLSQFQRVLTKA